MIHTLPPLAIRPKPTTKHILDYIYSAVNAQNYASIEQHLIQVQHINDPTTLKPLMSYIGYKITDNLVENARIINAWQTTVETIFDSLPIHMYFWLYRRTFYTSINPLDEGFLLLATFDSSGYIREAALRRAIAVSDELTGSLVACLIVRLADWVEPIRRLVAQYLNEYIKQDAITDTILVEILPLIIELDRYRTVDQTLKQQLLAYILTKEHVIRQGLTHHTQRIARAASVISKHLSHEQQQQLLPVGLNSKDPVIRLHWAEIGLSNESTRVFVYERLSKERVPTIILAVLTSMVNHNENNVVAALQAGLMSKSRRIRQFCQFTLKKRGIDAKYIYRSVLDSAANPDFTTSLLGLAECGDQSDEDYALFYVDAEAVSLRLAALRLLGVSGQTDTDHIFWDAFKDSHHSIARTAAQVLSSRANIELQTWLQVYDDASPFKKALLLRIARRLIWQDRQIAYVHALADPALTNDLRTIINGDRRYTMYIQ